MPSYFKGTGKTQPSTHEPPRLRLANSQEAQVIKISTEEKNRSFNAEVHRLGFNIADSTISLLPISYSKSASLPKP